jgi:uncharacterized protein
MRLLHVGLSALLGFAACRSSDSQRGAKPQSADPWAAKDPWAAGSQSGSSSTADPWGTSSTSTSVTDDVPTLTDRKKLADVACPTVTGPYFFRIEKTGHVSHILGTRHVGVPLSKFPPAVLEAIDSAKLAVFEVAPDDDSDLPDVQVEIANELGPKLWSHYRALVGSDVASSMERATPAAALLMMMVMHEDIGAMLDMEIERHVQKAGIPTRGLETSAFQDRVLAELLDMRMLRASIEQTEDRRELEKDSREDLTEYCAGTDDAPGMDPESRAEMMASGYTAKELDEIDEIMVYTRNADWIPKLEPILDRGDAFIAVGADHLTGDRGVISLLAKRGYKTTPVK